MVRACTFKGKHSYDMILCSDLFCTPEVYICLSTWDCSDCRRQFITHCFEYEVCGIKMYQVEYMLSAVCDTVVGCCPVLVAATNNWCLKRFKQNQDFPLLQPFYVSTSLLCAMFVRLALLCLWTAPCYMLGVWLLRHDRFACKSQTNHKKSILPRPPQQVRRAARVTLTTLAPPVSFRVGLIVAVTVETRTCKSPFALK